MKKVTSALLGIAALAAVYFVVDYLTTKDPNRRRTDLRDLRVLGAGVNVIKAI